MEKEGEEVYFEKEFRILLSELLREELEAGRGVLKESILSGGPGEGIFYVGNYNAREICLLNN